MIFSLFCAFLFFQRGLKGKSSQERKEKPDSKGQIFLFFN
jgi:hypothetical protein